MRIIRLALLIYLLILPILMVFAFDLRFNHLQHHLCNDYKRISSGICNDPALKERERLVTTGFYRHIADPFGRDRGTSPSFSEGLYNVLNDDFTAEAYDEYEAITSKLYAFNRLFAASMIISFILSGVAATLLVQMGIQSWRTKRHHKRKSLMQTIERIGRISLSRTKQL